MTGRIITKADYLANPANPHVTEMHGVKVELTYAPGMKPPFVVNTSYPA